MTGAEDIYGHGIGWAVLQMKSGYKVRRRGWNGKDMHIQMVVPAEGTVEPYVTMWTAQQRWQPGWLCSQTDLLAVDWELVP